MMQAIDDDNDSDGWAAGINFSESVLHGMPEANGNGAQALRNNLRLFQGAGVSGNGNREAGKPEILYKGRPLVGNQVQRSDTVI